MTRTLKATVTSREGAALLGWPVGHFHELATALGVQPLGRVRVGRSTLTVWSIEDITAALARRYARQVNAPGGEITTLAVECPTSGPASRGDVMDGRDQQLAVRQPEFHVLTIRATGPAGRDVTSVSLDGRPLNDVESITLELHADHLTRATIVMTVRPDVETPAAVTGPAEVA